MKRGPITQAEKDAAARMAEAVNLHVHARLAAGDHDAPGFVAIRLSDGRSPDGELFDSRRAVFRTHRHERAMFAVKVGIDTMGADEALIVLQAARSAYQRGVVFSEEEPITPHMSELMAPFIPRTLGGINAAREN